MGQIVVVNDEPNILEIVQCLLEEEGHSVRAFAHGPEALEALQDAGADLVIADGENHPMSGVEFVGRLRDLSHARVIFLSAWAQELEDQLRGTEPEAQAYIQLPFSSDELLQKVRLVLEQRPRD